MRYAVIRADGAAVRVMCHAACRSFALTTAARQALIHTPNSAKYRLIEVYSVRKWSFAPFQVYRTLCCLVQ